LWVGGDASVILTLDFETFYSKDFSLRKLTTEEYIRDNERFKVHGIGMKVNDQPSFYIWSEIKQFFATVDWSKAFVLCHNTRFDAAILNWRYGVRPHFLLDTLSLSRAVFPHESGSLANLSKLCGLGEKGDILASFMGLRCLTDAQRVEMAKYCMNDVDLTYKLFQVLKQKIPPSELKVIDQTLRMFTEPVLELDTKVLAAHLAGVKEKQATLLAGRDLTSLRSNQQFAQTLIDLGVDPPKKVSLTTGKETFAFAKTDEGMLSLLEHENEEVALLAAARLGVKSSIEESRTKMFLGIAGRGPFPVALDYFGARNSSRFGGAEATNVQNLPRGGELRKAIVAPARHQLVVADFNAIEARVLAWEAGQDDLLEQFRDGKDIYCEFASRVYAEPITKEENPTARAVGKASILGLGFGMGWRKAAAWFLSGPLGMPPISFGRSDLTAMGGAVDTTLDCKGVTTKLKGADLLIHCSAVKHLVDSYRQTYTKIPDYWKKCNRMLDCMLRGVKHKFGVLTTDHERMILPNGLAIHYKGLSQDGDSWWYVGKKGRSDVKQRLHGPKICENGTQALARIVMTDALLKISPHYKVVMTVHDELVACVPEGEAEEALGFMVATMSVAPAWCAELPLAAEGSIGRSYGEAK
jgi:DNA polymerase